MGTSSAELFDGHLHLVERLANKFMRYGKRGMEYDDLYQEIAIGLDKASKKYNASYNISFERYAVGTMYRSAMRFMMYKQNLLHTSKDVIELAVAINKKKMIDQTPQEIAKELGVREKRVILALQHLKQKFPVSVYQPIPGMGHDETGLILLDLFEDKTDAYNPALLDTKLFFNALEPQKKKIIELHLQELSQQEIAQILGISQPHVGRLLKKIKGQYIEYMQIS